MMDYDVDVAVIGGGLAGISAAITAAKNGLNCCFLHYVIIFIFTVAEYIQQFFSVSVKINVF